MKCDCSGSGLCFEVWGWWVGVGHILGLCCPKLGAMLPHLGAMFAHLEAHVGPCLTHLEPQAPKKEKKCEEHKTP